jgi:hypothetical protein
VTLSSRLRSDLHRDCEEALLIALGVASDERLDLVSSCHCGALSGKSTMKW